MRRFGALAASIVLALTVGIVILAAPPAQAVEICEQYGTTVVQNRYIIQNNRWGANTAQCINTTDTGFTITRAEHNNSTNGPPASYPSIYYGCHYGNCSPGTILPMALTDSALSGISTSVNFTFVSNATYNAAYDIWLDPTPRRDGQNTGAEIMIWANRQGSIQPIGAPVATVNLAGATWQVWFGNVGWNVVSYVRSSPATSLNFSVSTFINDAVSRGYAQRSWYLTSIQAGFEPWIGGAGLAVNNFSVTTGGPGGGGGGGGSGGTAACSATYQITNSWSAGFQGEVTVRNTGASALSGWAVTWAYSGGQTVSQLWNGTLVSPGPSVTVRNASWNGALAPGAQTTFGFTANGTAASPALSCAPG
jgi:hypothetical protein